MSFSGSNYASEVNEHGRNYGELYRTRNAIAQGSTDHFLTCF